MLNVVKRTLFFGSWIAISALCASCDAAPKVQYGANSESDVAGLIKFRLAKSAIMVDYGKSQDGKSIDKTKLSLVSVPQEEESATYTIREVSSAFTATHLKVTKRENTDLLQSIGVEVEDRRVQLIQQLGSIAGAVVSAAALVETGPALPQAIDVSQFLASANPGRVDGAGSVDGLSYAVVISPVPADATPTAGYVATFRKGAESNVLFYSACRDATVTFASGLFVGKSATVRIADPKFVQTIALPAKGQVTFHSACGVNVTSEKAGTATELEVLNALITQAKTLLENKKKK